MELTGIGSGGGGHNEFQNDLMESMAFETRFQSHTYIKPPAEPGADNCLNLTFFRVESALVLHTFFPYATATISTDWCYILDVHFTRMS